MLVLSLFPREVLGRHLSHFKPVPEEADELVREAYVALPPPSFSGKNESED